jgi:hypothetical protein
LTRTGGRIHVRRLDSLETRIVAGSETINNPGFWSPDSTTFVYPSLRHEWEKVRMPDGAPQGIGPLVGASRGGTWSDAGTILLSLGKMPTFRLSTLPSAGGDLTAVIFSKESGDAGTIPSSLGKTPPFRLSTLPSTGGDLKDVDFPKQFSAGDYIYPEFIPGSEDFLFFYLPLPDAEGGSVYLATLHEGKCVNPIPLLVNETGARYTPAGEGRLLYVRNDNLYSQKLNLRRRALEGEADLVVQESLRRSEPIFQ